jgi:DeoR family transcriptional regulator, aga operon transcriptional repressor
MGGAGAPTDSQLPTAVRRERMLAALKTREFTRVAELERMFGVSAVTVRGDLDALAGRGQVRRVHGGAMPLANPRAERSFEDSRNAHASEKTAIGRAAAELVSSGDTVVLDVGTTTTAVAVALVARDDLHEVTVFTNGLNIALELERAAPRVTVVVSGGTLRPLQHSLVNPLGTALLERLRGSVAFVGCNGVDPEVGITSVNLPEAEIKRAMLLACRRRVIVADGSKVGEAELAKVCDIEQVSLLVTDPTADPEVLTKIAAAGCQVELAG